MRKLLLIPVLLAVVVAGAPASSALLSAAPQGGETNPLGTLRWLPDNANEQGQVAANSSRLVLTYDRSMDAAGNPTDLLGKGPFGLKLYTTSQADVRMKAHSPSVSSLDDAGLPPEAVAVDEAFAGVAGDVRDGACSKVDTGDFSAAYSTTRSFSYPGSTPYQPVSAPGVCERVDSSIPIVDATGNVIGYSTTVTSFAPGFWIDLAWTGYDLPAGAGTGRFLADLWYGAVYDEDGEDGEFYEVADAQGNSESVGSPGDYDYVFAFTANPGSIGAPCPGFPGLPQAPSPAGTWQDVKVQVPGGASQVTFKLFPKGDWDMRIVDPDGAVGNSGYAGGFEETEVVPSGGNGNIPDLIPGEFTMRACNYTGEQAVFGAVIIQ